jgi:hypothetical protein
VIVIDDVTRHIVLTSRLRSTLQKFLCQQQILKNVDKPKLQEEILSTIFEAGEFHAENRYRSVTQ